MREQLSARRRGTCQPHCNLCSHTHIHTHTYSRHSSRGADCVKKTMLARQTQRASHAHCAPLPSIHAHTHTHPHTQSASQHTLGMHSSTTPLITHSHRRPAVNVLLRGELADEEMHLRDVERRRACAHRAVFSKTNPPRGLSVGSAMAPPSGRFPRCHKFKVDLTDSSN
jgi:hypothetical protein